MRKLLSLFLFLPLFSMTQGIKFEEGLSWEQVKAKARAESKYIFIDCYATWCKPCKVMDKEVYPNDTVGRIVNSNFISVKLQMDTTKNDSKEIRSWYATAAAIRKEYNIQAMPSLLFFSPDGTVVHKDVGQKNVQGFMLLATDATDPGKQYYSLVRKYNEGQFPYQQMPSLFSTANNLNEKEFASKVAGEYMRQFLDKMPEAQYCTKENLEFLGKNVSIIKSTDRIFNLCLFNPEKIDAVARIGYARFIVDYIITKEEITPQINMVIGKGKDPSWEKISKTIKKKYGVKYVERNIIKAKVLYYQSKKDMPLYAKYLGQIVEMKKKNKEAEYSISTYLNENSWNVFLYSNNKDELKNALEWCDRALQLDSVSFNVPLQLDTWANLLYKLGRKEEAIKMQERAVHCMNTEINKSEKQLGKLNQGIYTAQNGLKITLERMKNDQPTYPDEAIWNKKLLPKKRNN